MFAYFLYSLAAMACFFGAVLIVERLLCWVMRVTAPLLPNEFCGPDGWLLDTERHSGVFDPRARD